MKTNISEKFQSLTFKGIKNIPLSRKRYHKQCERSKFKQNDNVVKEILSLGLHILFLPVLLLIELDTDLEMMFDT